MPSVGSIGLLAFRLIARMDIKGPDLIKTRQMEGVRKVGDPEEFARKYDADGIDEIVFLDAVASLYGRNHLSGLLAATSDVFVPVCAGGGVVSVEGAVALLREGADKVAINTAATKSPQLIDDIAAKIGSQSTVLQLDVKNFEAYCDGGREPTGRQALDWAREAVDRGAGEIILTDIANEGTGNGIDTELVATIATSVGVPVIVSGGVGMVEDCVEAYRAGASGVAMAGALHYDRLSLADIRNELRGNQIPCRTVSSPGQTGLSGATSAKHSETRGTT